MKAAVRASNGRYEALHFVWNIACNSHCTCYKELDANFGGKYENRPSNPHPFSRNNVLRLLRPVLRPGARAGSYQPCVGTLTMKVMRWAVIENAGYEGECVIASNFTHWTDAHKYVRSHYDADEQESLHVDVAHWDEDGEFWSYDH